MFRVALLCVLIRALLVCEADTPDNNMQIRELHLFDGDILLPSEKRKLLHWNDHPDAEDGTVGAHITLPRQTRAVVKLKGSKWVEGVVPYEFASEINETGINTIRSAMDSIMLDTGSCVKFRPKQPYDADYLHIFPGNGCFSHIGRQGGAQNLSLGPQCQVKGVVMHELIHALGRWHEQSRPDRNDYVIVNESNIKELFVDNFKIMDGDATSTQGLRYDYDSIMHYDAYAFSLNERPTIQPVDPSVDINRLGQRERLSEIDSEHIKRLYRMVNQWSRWSSWIDCSASCGSGFRHRSRECLIRDENEPFCVGNDRDEEPCNVDECPTAVMAWSSWSTWSGCSQSCGRGLRVRIRSCTHKDACEGRGVEEEEQECNVRECPQESEWTAWSKWTLCSKRCKGGRRHRSRECSSSVTTGAAGRSRCLGDATESMACFANVSCVDSERKACSCFNNTCLDGLTWIGHYRYLPPLLEYESDMVDSDESDFLKTCGEYARLKDLPYFGLWGHRCYCSSNLSDLVQGGPLLESCEGEGCGECVQVFQIAERERFELSVKVYESCGAEFCKQEGGSELVCSSGGERTAQWHTALHVILWLLLACCIFC